MIAPIKRALCWLLELHQARQRAIDLRVLWPACRSAAPDLDTARAAFAIHAMHDPAWLSLGEDEIIQRISELT